MKKKLMIMAAAMCLAVSAIAAAPPSTTNQEIYTVKAIANPATASPHQGAAGTAVTANSLFNFKKSVGAGISPAAGKGTAPLDLGITKLGLAVYKPDGGAVMIDKIGVAKSPPGGSSNTDALNYSITGIDTKHLGTHGGGSGGFPAHGNLIGASNSSGGIAIT